MAGFKPFTNATVTIAGIELALASGSGSSILNYAEAASDPPRAHDPAERSYFEAIFPVDPSIFTLSVLPSAIATLRS